MLSDVQLNKSTWDKQRNSLARPVEQVVQQRAAAVRQFAERDEEWAQWGARTGASLVITATVLDRWMPAELRLDRRFWALEISLDAADYESLKPGAEVSLRFVQSLEQVLVTIASQVEDPPPTQLGRTRSESDWLAQGGTDPGPGTATPLRIRQPPGPMPDKRFWAVIEGTTDEGSGAFRLGWQQADRFTSRLRLLVAALDSPAHRSAAASALGFVSDDVWEDIRAWVVSRGPDAYSRALADPVEVRRLLGALDSEDQLSLGERLLHLQGHD